MKSEGRTEYITRDTILGLLSPEEVASVSTVEATARLNAGDEYLDLEHLHLGVRKARGSAAPPKDLLAKKAVAAATWERILSELLTPLP